MNKKLYFSLIYLIIGTFLIISVLIVIAFNFERDARIMELVTNILTKLSK